MLFRSGDLRSVKVEWSEQSSACVVLASAGYPGNYATGVAIEGLDRIATTNELQVFHAGTAKAESAGFVTAGGRVLGVTAAADTLEQALDNCYDVIRTLDWKGMQYRRDIGRFRSGYRP